jgi:hypothetical protein
VRGILPPGASERVFRSERIEIGTEKGLRFVLGAYGGKSGVGDRVKGLLKFGPCACGAAYPPLRLRLKAGDPLRRPADDSRT